jgi:glycosyltransferase involved in cell wall biosynthesis
MKIGIVVPFFTPYIMGNEYELAASLAKLGASVTIITSRSRAPREKMVSTQHAAPEALPFAVKYVPLLLDAGEIPLAPGSYFEVLRDDYDVLLLQEDYQPICHFAYCAARRKKVPTVLSTERNYTPAGIKGTVLSVFDLTINRPIRRGATAYTAHDRAARDYVEEHLGVRKGRVRVIPIGTDTDFFRYRTGGEHLKDGRFKILTVARLHPYKGLDHLIKAMDIVHKKDDGIVLYIKGNGPQVEQLKGLAAGLGLQDVVRFLDRPVDKDQMPLMYSEADLYCQPSVVEPFGCAPVEAQACSRPVLCAKTGGMLDTVDDGKTGFLVPPADPEALAEKILLLASDEAMRARMGTAAREWAVARFDWSVVVRQYMDLITSITAPGK